MLSTEEIKQFHQTGTIYRECKLMDRIPYVVKTYSVRDNIEFAEKINQLEVSDSQIYIQNVLAKNTLASALVSFNNEKATPEMIDRFLPEKCNRILEGWRKLCNDLIEYLNTFPEQPLVDEEIEEYILTDTIIRTETFEYEGVPPLKVSFKILSLGEIENLALKLKEITPRDATKAYATAISDLHFAAAIIKSINNMPVDLETINRSNAEFANFILRRAANIEEQLRKKLSNPKEIGESLKN